VSYCRFSSDDFRSDVYVYADSGGGWTTNVAGNRLVFDQPLPPEVELPTNSDGERFAAWAERHRIVRSMIDRAERVYIGLPYDGECFNDPSPGACADRLEMLQRAGYTVPQYAIDALRDEDREARPE
jgi:hypothetical protein